MVTKLRGDTFRKPKNNIGLLKSLDDTKKNAGFHCLFGKKSYINGKNFVRYDKNALRESKLVNNKHDWWISPNTMRTWHRNSSNVIGLNAVWIDVDCNHDPQNAVDKGEFICDFITQVDVMGNFPKPTAIVDSGRGFHIIYVFDHQIVSNNPCMTKLWRKLEYSLIKRLNQLCVKNFGKKLCDSSADDPSRLLRVPDSYNPKTDDRRCEVEAFNKDVRPSMFKMVHEYLPDYDKIKRERTKKKRSKSFHKGLRKVTGNKTLLTLKYSRVADLLTWLKLNHYSIHNYRDKFLFIYACNAVCIESKKSTMTDIEKINDELAEPLPESEIRWIKAEIIHCDLSKYHYSNSKIMDLLNISSKDQKHLIVLINLTEKYSRKKNKRAKISRKKKSKKRIRDKRIVNLHKNGLSIRKIAKKIHTSRSTVQRCLHNNY